MTHNAVLLNHPDFLDYDFGSYHPLRPERITAGLDLLHILGIYDASEDGAPVIASTREELELVHDPRYINAVMEAGIGGGRPGVFASFGLHSSDNPPFLLMHDASSMVTGGTVEGTRMVMRGEADHAFNPAGGLHHAQRAKASGFSIYNDSAVAAAVAISEFGARVFYVDFDCHHGDGVQWIFYGDPRVFTLSFHESGRYLFPGTGFPDELGIGEGEGTSVNVPFEPLTRDVSWLVAVQSLVPELLRRFEPDLVISNHGCDTHQLDPLTHLSLSSRAFAEQARLVHELAHAHTEGRWIAVGSGGYEWVDVVPRSWAILWSEMTCRALPEYLPDSWLERWQPHAEHRLQARFLDPDTDPAAEYPEVSRVNSETLSVVRSHFNFSSPTTT
jgi:acetoin utilization protein AcuC